MPLRLIFFCVAGAALVQAVGCSSNHTGTKAASAEESQAGVVDFLDYFLQSDDRHQSWTLGGTDVRPGQDPDGAGGRTFILSKFSDPNTYEVYKVTDRQVQIRYEVVRTGGKSGKENWIRRYEEIDGEGKTPGAVWINRWVTPGGRGVLSRFRQDKFAFDEKSRCYVIDRESSVAEFPSYVSAVWAQTDWGRNNHSGFRLEKVLRVIAQWQREGLMLEHYDYAKGKGLVGWRWLERVSTLKPMPGDTTGRIFHCEEGFVLVAEKGEGGTKPVVFKYDPKTGAKGRQLEVIEFTSYWRPEMGKQWYVVYRDLSKEMLLKKKDERIAHDYSLPEWEAKPGATISDLPGLYTHPTKESLK